jgi:hypothetical protein
MPETTAKPERDLTTHWVKVETLIPYVRNARTHSPEQVDQIAGSLREFGWTNPVLIDEEGGIIAGHGRVLAARKLGMAQVPTITLSGLTRAQKQAYMLVDNQLALNAGWDTALLKIEIEELADLKFDLGLIGFSDAQLHDIRIGDQFQPGGREGQGSLDQLAPKLVTCPHCGEVFDLRTMQGGPPADIGEGGDGA